MKKYTNILVLSVILVLFIVPVLIAQIAMNSLEFLFPEFLFVS